MPFAIDTMSLEPVISGLLGGIDVSGGPTDEQLSLLDALCSRVWGHPDLDLGAMERLGPADVAQAITDPSIRRRFHELHVALEACRHPQTLEQVELVERYAEALAITGPDLALFRSSIEQGIDRASLDYRRFLTGNVATRGEPSLGAPTDAPEPDLVARLRAFADLPEGSLGRSYFDFYEATGLGLPGEVGSVLNHFFVAHDMTHVIAGISTTAAGEVALSAFQMGMDDNPTNTGALLASLIAHEAGFGTPGTFDLESETLADSGAMTLLVDELARGSSCTGDFSLVDHLAIAEVPLAEVRERFGVPAPNDPDDGHHIW